jgi:hypothetical protein
MLSGEGILSASATIIAEEVVEAIIVSDPDIFLSPFPNPLVAGIRKEHKKTSATQPKPLTIILFIITQFFGLPPDCNNDSKKGDYKIIG